SYMRSVTVLSLTMIINVSRSLDRQVRAGIHRTDHPGAGALGRVGDRYAIAKRELAGFDLPERLHHERDLGYGLLFVPMEGLESIAFLPQCRHSRPAACDCRTPVPTSHCEQHVFK